MKLTDTKGIGPKKKEVLNELGINSVEDLILYIPKKYDDRSNKTLVKDSINGEKHYYELTVDSKYKTYFYKRNKSITNINAHDDSSKVKIIWYNDRFSARNLVVGEKYKFYGIYNSEKKAIINPIVSKIDDEKIGGIYPIYSSNKDISSNIIRKFIINVLNTGYKLKEYISKDIIKKYNLMEINEIIYNIHNPKDSISLYKTYYNYYLRKLYKEKLLYKYLSDNKDNKYIKFNEVDLKPIYNNLEFELTRSQNDTLEDIINDMTSDKKMNRIIVGDVGSGKTILAIISAYMAIKNGYQVAFMAPTEILAIQHYKKYKDFFNKLNIKSSLLIGSNTNKEKENIYYNLRSDNINIIFGTHALFQDKVKYNNLGLVIIDEQQRFGVEQRKNLHDKGIYPDTLLLSATPIPRTLALSLYNQLNISFIEELPKGRLPIKSYLTSIYQEKDFMSFAYKQIQDGRQVYVISSRVDENEDLESVYNLYKKISKFFGDKINVDILHGKMSPEEKEEIQNRFSNNEINMLVATSIVEVGIDVKNANTIIIYDSYQFGLSQLHQMRGRVGRSSYQSYCFFVLPDKKYLNEKMKFIANNLDGYEIAKKDLELRGYGKLYGTIQSGDVNYESIFLFNEKLIETVNEIIEDIDVNDINIEKYIKENLEDINKIILN